MRDLQAMQAAATEVVIFAAQPHQPEDVMHFLASNNIRFKTLLGSYKGTREVSFLVSRDRFDDVMSQGFLDQQESILVLKGTNAHDQRIAEIVYLNANEEQPEGVLAEEVGIFVEATREEAEAQDGYSFDPSNEKFYIIKPKD
jgi:hypothetical protein